MATFELAIPTILHHEGRFSDNSADTGGATNYGISLAFLKSTGDLDNDGWPDGDIDHNGETNVEDIKMLKIEQATKLYRLYFWDKYRYSMIIDQSIATKLFDLSVNMGGLSAHKVAQRALRSALGVKLQEDGIIGFRTIHGLNMAVPSKLLPALKSEAAGFYRLLVERRPKLKLFLEGWLNRAYSDEIASPIIKDAA